MNINVQANVRSHFWEEPPEGHIEFWSFRWKPPCEVGDELFFRFDKKIVARAKVDRIEKPGISKCARTGGFENGWKVFWLPESFVDMRAD